MDLNTIGEIARPNLLDKAIDWRDGDAWLAGGTWLFSEQQPHLRRLIDLEGLGWQSLVVSDRGLEIGATCRCAGDWAVLPVVSFVVENLEDGVGGWQRLHVAAGGPDDIAYGRARR